MKKTIFLIAGLAGFVSIANAQKLTSAKVPAAVKSAFKKMHPDVKTVKWEMEKNDYEAGFTLKGKATSENYTPSGTLLESETEIKVSELPKEVRTYIAMHHKNAKIKEAAKITKADGLVSYEAEVESKDLLFDAKGNLLK